MHLINVVSFKEVVNRLLLHTQAVRISGFLQVMLCMYNSFVSLRKECLSGVVNMAALCSVSKTHGTVTSHIKGNFVIRDALINT